MYSQPTAKVICDSISPAGARLTTMEIRLVRFTLAEFNTHRRFSRNCASSRAIPVQKRIDMVLNDPAMPVEWGKNGRGMQSSELLSDQERSDAERIWLEARDLMVAKCQELMDIGVHKQLVNRLIEPWAWVTDIISATEWQNFFSQRCSKHSPLAQPEMRATADAMLAAYEASTPKLVNWGSWHLPYIQDDEWSVPLESLKRISVARCARVSYKTHDGKVNLAEDLALYAKLADAKPPHWSPMEHVATPVPARGGNFDGWVQLRQYVGG